MSINLLMIAYMVRPAVEWISNLRVILRLCVITVWTDINSASAISLLVMPFTTHTIISFSLALNVSLSGVLSSSLSFNSSKSLPNARSSSYAGYYHELLELFIQAKRRTCHASCGPYSMLLASRALVSHVCQLNQTFFIRHLVALSFGLFVMKFTM